MGMKKPLNIRGFGAEDRARTGHLDLGKVALYQLSYTRLSAFLEARSGVEPD